LRKDLNVPVNAQQLEVIEIETKYTNAASCERCEQQKSETLAKVNKGIRGKKAASRADGGDVK